MRLAVPGPTETVKLEDVVTLKGLLEVALCVPNVTLMSPVPAPAGTTKDSPVVEYAETGADMEPPARVSIVT